MAGITTYLSISKVNVNGLKSPIKRLITKWIKKEDLTISYCKKPALQTEAFITLGLMVAEYETMKPVLKCYTYNNIS
jgi:hypothetical protein